jgi:hypothetical protein
VKRSSVAAIPVLVLAVLIAVAVEKSVPPAIPAPERGPAAIAEFFAHWFGELGFPMDWTDRDNLRTAYGRMGSELEGPPVRRLPGWQFMGPRAISSHVAYPNQHWSFGRVAYFEDLPGLNRFRIAAPTGGLWEIDNDFGAPIPLSDTIEAPFGLVCGAFATHPTNEDIIIMGSGVPGYANGSGLWVTGDRGVNWSSIKVSQFPQDEPTIYFRIRFDPVNPIRVHLATDTGYWLSTDGGLNYAKILNGSASEVAFIPGAPNIIYTANTTGADSSGIYRSDDAGDTFVQLTGGGAPESGVGRTSIAVAPGVGGNLATIYASLTDSGVAKVYRSGDDGLNWDDITPANSSGLIRGWYNNTIAVDPVWPGHIVVGWVRLYWSNDSGQTWQIADGLHSDFHTIGWDDGTHMYVGNDAGLARGDIPDPGNTDFSWSTPGWFPIAQTYEVDVSPTFPEFAIFGMQDNGIATTFNLINDNGILHWGRGGDAGSVALDPVDGPWWAVDVSDDQTSPLAFHNFTAFDQGVTWEDKSSGLQNSNKFIRHVRSPRVPAQDRRIVTYSGDKVYGSTDGGENWNELNATPFSSVIMDIAIGDTKGDNVWAVTDKANTDFDDRILYRNDNGAWAERSQSIPNFLLIVRIAPADAYGNRPQEAYALVGPGSTGSAADGNRLFFTDDAGVSWQNLTGNIPVEMPIFDLVENPTDPDILYLATAAGVLRTTDRGATWNRWNVDWPEAVIVTRLIANYPAQGRGFLYATTYGRGLWRRDISGDMTISTAVPAGQATRLEFRVQQNPAVGSARFQYALAEAAPVTLEVFDLRGRRVRHLEFGGVSGLNTASWSGRDDAGSLTANGVYFAVLRTPLETASARFTLMR